MDENKFTRCTCELKVKIIDCTRAKYMISPDDPAKMFPDLTDNELKNLNPFEIYGQPLIRLKNSN